MDVRFVSRGPFEWLGLSEANAPRCGALGAHSVRPQAPKEKES